MTQQQVFALYLANENQRVAVSVGNYKYDGDLQYITPYYISLTNVKKGFSGHPILSDCKLILKPISEMSEEHCKEFVNLGLPDFYNRDYLIFKRGEKGFWFENSRKMLYGHRFDFTKLLNGINPDQFFWLITHGYCLNNEWHTNGWVIWESEK